MWVWEDPLEEGMATHSSILAWKIPWTENSMAGCKPQGHKELDIIERSTAYTYPHAQPCPRYWDA